MQHKYIPQYQEAIYWIYDKLEATIANPIPSIRWTTEDPILLQQNWPIGIEELPVGELSNSLESLVKVFNLILNKAPVLTQIFLNTIDTYLTHQDRLRILLGLGPFGPQRKQNPRFFVLFSVTEP